MINIRVVWLFEKSEMISDDTMKNLCSKLVPINYLVRMENKNFKYRKLKISNNLQNIASDARKQREKRIKQILEKRKIPDAGFDDMTIELLVNEIAQLDSNNFVTKCGVGEREARIVCGEQLTSTPGAPSSALQARRPQAFDGRSFITFFSKFLFRSRPPASLQLRTWNRTFW